MNDVDSSVLRTALFNGLKRLDEYEQDMRRLDECVADLDERISSPVTVRSLIRFCIVFFVGIIIGSMV